MSSAPPAANPPRIPSLDGLRGIAALTVFVSHYSNKSGLWGGYAGQGAGQIGVMLFFALSSFLMFYLYFEQQQPKLQLVRNFAISRAARVLPLFFFMIIASLLLRAGGVAEGYGITAENIIRHFFLVQGNDVLWTIGPEIAFYGFFAILLIPPRSWAVTILMAVILLALLLGESVGEAGLGGSSNNLLRSFYAYKFFVIGPIVVFVVNRTRKIPPVVSWRLSSRVAAAAMIVIWFLHYPQIHGAVFGHILPQNGWNSLQVMFVVGLALYCAIQNPSLRAVLGTRPLMFLGDISYSVYLTHIFVLQLLGKYDLVVPNVLGLLACTALVIAVSFTTYRLIELPSRRYLRRFLVSGSPASDFALPRDTSVHTPTVPNRG